MRDMWWLSFAGAEGFRGVCIVGPAADIVEAAKLAHLHGCNPGGEVMGVKAPDDFPLIESDVNHLYRTNAEAAALDDELDRRREARSHA